MKNSISILIGLFLVSTSVSAQVNSNQIPAVLTEEAVLTLKSKNLTSKANPLKVSIVTADGATTNLATVVNNKTSAQVQLPNIPDSVDSLLQVTLKISGGDVNASAPQEFARILTKKPVGFTGDGNIAGTPPSLPTTTISGIILEGAQGPKGENGAVGATGPKGADGVAGPQGPVGPVPLNYPGTSIVGDVPSAIIFSGNLAGDVTGPMSATAISNATITSKQLNGGYVAAAGTVANGNTLQSAIAKIDGNSIANANAIIATNAVLGIPASTNSLGQIVRRDASGDFAANIITANSFSGPLTGNVTGNLTGQVVTGTQSSITTLPAATSIGTSGITTTFSGPISVPQGITGPISGAVTGNVTGNITGDVTGNVSGNLTGTVLTSTQNSITRMDGLTRAGTSGIKTSFLGPVNGAEGFVGNLTGNLTGTVLTATQNSIATMTGLTNVGTAGTQTQFQGPVKGNQGFIGDITGNVTGNVNGNVNGNATNATNATNVSGAAQPGITSLGGLLQIGSFGNTVNFSGSAAVAQNFNVTGALTAGSLSSSGTITAPKFVGTFQGNVLTPSQPLITTLAGLTAAGTAGTTTTFSGPVAAPQGVTANVLGNLTGNVTGNVSGSAGALANVSGTGALTYDGTAGNFSSVLRTTANTDVTLPTAGTVATLAGAETFTNKTINAASNTLSNIGTTSISNDAITYAKLQNVATGKLLARVSAGAGDVEEVDFTSFAQTLVDDANAAAARTTLGLGTIATLAAPTGTVVGTTDTQLLTNKTLEDSTVSFVDETDVSKVLKFELSGITAATTRTITAPDADGTLTLLGNTATGTGSVVLATSPTLVTPVLGVASATSVNKVAITAPATGATLALADNSSLNTVGAYSLTLTTTAATDVTLPTTGTLATTAEVATKADDAATTAALAGKQPLNSALTSISGLATSANQMIYTTAANTYATTSATSYARTNLGFGTATNIETEVTQTYDATNIAVVTMIDTDADATADDILTIGGGVPGQRLLIVVGSTTTETVDIIDGANLFLNANTNFSGSAGDTLELVSDGTNWYEISRADN